MSAAGPPVDRVRWTPAHGARDLVRRHGTAATRELLRALLGGRPDGSELLHPPYRDALRSIGDGHAERLMSDPSGARLAYWPRVWAARALSYVGDDRAAPALLSALGDEHWRVRMTAAQALGRLQVEGHDDVLVPLLRDRHRRVREAAAVTMGRTGGDDAVVALSEALDDEEESVRAKADRALARVERRLARMR